MHANFAATTDEDIAGKATVALTAYHQLGPGNLVHLLRAALIAQRNTRATLPMHENLAASTLEDIAAEA